MKKLVFSLSIAASLLAFNCSKDDDKKDDSTDNDGTGSDFVVKADDFKGDIENGEVTLEAGTSYMLTGALVVKEGATLNIPAGTVITAKSGTGTAAFIGVERGAKINVNGTSDNPVVMTAETKEAGSWGGLAIAGYGVTNAGEEVTSEVADLTYGGTNNGDSSGSLKYLRVEYTGATFTNDKEFNGVTFFGVGSGTVVENVSSYEGGDDGIEFFGGAVNAKNLVSINSGDDSIDFADGFQGSIDGAYIKGITKAGIEGSNNGDNGNATPVTKATVKNVTMVVDGKGNSEGAIYFKEGGGEITYANIYTKDVNLGVKIKSTDTEANARLDKLSIFNFDFNTSGEIDYGVAENKFQTSESYSTNGAGNNASEPSWANGWSVPTM